MKSIAGNGDVTIPKLAVQNGDLNPVNHINGMMNNDNHPVETADLDIVHETVSKNPLKSGNGQGS